jgi:4'-phosphopantetheinyl transferase
LQHPDEIDGRNRVAVYYRPTRGLDDADVARAVAVLSQDERARCARLMTPADRRDYATAHGLLRESLSRFSDVPPGAWQFERSPSGKPFIVDASAPTPWFSLSHTRGMVACAVTWDHQIGVDVEAIDRVVNADVAGRFFSQAESDDLHGRTGDDHSSRFIERWTLKEAFGKATGDGLWPLLNAAVFDLPGPGSIVFRPPDGVDASRWQFALYAPAARYRLAVAIQRGSGGPTPVAVVSIDHSEPLLPVRTSII